MLREDKKKDAHQRLLTSALALFREHGVEVTTVNEITQAAGTAKGTFFNYFPTKEHVLVAYYDDLLVRALNDASERRRSTSAEARISQLLSACARAIEPDIELARALLRALFSSEIVKQSDRDIEHRLQKLLRSELEEGIEQRELRSDLELEVFVSLLLGALSTSIQDWVLDGGETDLHRTLLGKLGVLFRAARTEGRSRDHVRFRSRAQ